MTTATGRLSRREALAAGVSLAGTTLTGCGGSLTSVHRDPEAVSVLAAGSLNGALENGLAPSTDVPIRIEAHGSARAARFVAEGQKSPDVVSLADVSLFDAPLSPSWYAEFATNALVVACNPGTEGGRRLRAAGEEWYRPVLRGEVRLGRTDPDLDPLGYRTLFVLDLATEYYDADANLRTAVPSGEQIYPETQLIGQFETGAIDGAVTYRNMAVERGYAFLDLPAEIDLSDPAYADRYATATYTLPDGTRVRGAPITYGSTVRGDRGDSGDRDDATRERVVRAFEAHVAGDYLTEFGFGVPDDYPRFTGDVPEAIAN